MFRLNSLLNLSVQFLLFFTISSIHAEINGLPSAEQEQREIDELITSGEMEEIIPSKTIAKRLALPRAYDRSLDDAMVPIRGQRGGSCTGWATTYYSGTWVIANREGWDAANGGDKFRFSPHWTYNFVNRGNDNGSSNSYCNEVLKKHGAVPWEDFYPPETINDRRHRATIWCDNPDLWREAIKYRFESTKTLRDVNTPDGLKLLKESIFDPYTTLSYGTNSPTSGEHWQFTTIKDDPSTDADDEFVGQKACYKVDSNHGGRHAMAIVGWNDDIWVDVNQNGQIDAGEKGVLKVSESHGVTKKNSNDGYYFLSYDALHEQSQVVNGPNNERSEAFSGRSVVCAQAPESYTPVLAAEFTLQSAARDDIELEFVRVRPQATEPFDNPEASWKGWVFGTWRNDDDNRLGFDGLEHSSTNDAPEMTFVFDLTNIFPDPNEASEAWKYVMIAQDQASGKELIVKSFKLINPANGETYTIAGNLPVTVDNGTEYVTAYLQMAVDAYRQSSKSPALNRVLAFESSPGTITFTFPYFELGIRKISVMNISGKKIWSHDSFKNRIIWNWSESEYNAVKNNVIFVTLELNSNRITEKLTLVK